MTTPTERPAPDECPVCRSKDIRVHEGDTFRWRYAICDACGFRGDEVRISTLGPGSREEWEAEVRLEAIADMHRIYDACTAPLRAENGAQARRLNPLEAAQGWQPIETAPKDGTLLLCWVSAIRYGETDEGQQYQEDVSQVDFCEWRTQADIPDCGWFDPCCGQIGDQQGITHWMPLPVAPGAASNGGPALPPTQGGAV